MAYYSDRDYKTLEYHPDGVMTSNADHAVDSDATYNNQIDLMSFMSLIARSEEKGTEKWTSSVLLSIHLGPWNLFLPFTPYRGTSFSVTLVPRQYLLRQTDVRLDSGHLIPKLVALKTPRLSQEDQRNSQLFRSIAKEYQILQSESLKRHENIVSVCGCCWQSLDIYAGLPIPCLILEGTELGDLVNFSQTRELTLRERLRICIHVTSGLEAIHSIGIVHGDLKPENILVFHSKQRGYTAKIADFGSAILLGETTLPCRKQYGTDRYSAPECYDSDVAFGREELFKTDIFSLGIVLSILIQGMYVLEEITKLSGSRLESLKREGQLGNWIIALSRQGLKNITTQDIIESADHDKAWETDPAFDEDSILADEQIWTTFACLLQGTLAVPATQRFASEESILSILRNILRSHLRKTLGHSETAARTNFTRQTPQWWSRMSSVLEISKARLKKVTGASIALPTRLDPQEIEAISLYYLLGKHSSNLFSELQFIRKHTTNKQQRMCRSSKRQLCARQSFSKRQQARASFYHKADIRSIRWMREIATAWIKKQLVTPTELTIIEIEKKIFKATRDSNLFWLLPPTVKTLLEDRLLHEATNSSMSKDYQAEAAYEYAVMIFNSVELSASRLVKALDLLAQSAKNGNTNARCTFGRLHDIFGYSSPVPREVEIEWLLSASNKGSLTAQKRLQALDPKLFKQALQNSRCHYGVVCPELSRILNEQYQLAMESDDPSEILFSHIHQFASTGNVQSLLRLPRLPRSVFNCVNRLGETPLLIASRSGHATAAALLLERGSDPSIATNDGVTALHFLSAFDDEHIPKMATLLLKHGAELDKLSGDALIYKEMFDSPFGVLGGTPLLWAVAARNSCATEVLVDKGANPFERIKEPLNGRDDGFEMSPIGWAAIFHQYRLLKILLSYAKIDAQRQDLKRRLNTSFDRSRTSFTTALSAAIDCNLGFRFREYLIHGKYFEQVPVKCVQLLIEYGADPMICSGSGDHPITMACVSGNIPTLKYLWDYKNGSLRPTPKIWMDTLQHVIFNRHRLIFDFLIDHRGDVAPDHAIDKAAIEKCCINSNDQHFVLGSLKLILQQPKFSDPSPDHTELFEVAVTTGQFEAARLLFQNGGVCLTRRLDDSTILGSLISVSSNFPNMEQKVTFILSLLPNRDELFWNVTYLEGSGLTALQAIVFSSTNGGRMGAGVFHNILDHFNDPQYLNAQIKGAAHHKYTGFTALHLAAQCGNSGAVFTLVEGSMANRADANLLNSHGESPADICLAREQEFARRGKFRPHNSFTHNERQNNLQILRELLLAGGRISKFATIIETPAQDDYEVESAVNKLQDIFISEKYTPKEADEIYYELKEWFRNR